MPEEACPMPGAMSDDEQAAVGRMLAARRIAVVGLSDNPDRPSHEVSQYLQQHGYEIVPVNPNIREALGVPAVGSLAELAGPVDLALVFRASEVCEQVTWDAIKAGVKGVWLQSGIRSEPARKLARDAGVDFVQDRCMMVTHMRRAP